MFVNLDLNEIELRRIDLNLLPVLHALARTHSVKGAAERLGLTAPAVSMALARLRALTGDPLFVRGRAGFEPTPRALELVDALEPCLVGVRDTLLGRRGFDPATAQNTFRFAAPDDLENYLVPAVAARLATEAQGVSLVLRPADFRSVPGQLDCGEADLALTATPQLDRRHRMSVAQPNEHFLALYDPAQLNIAGGGSLTLDQYLSVPHLLRSPDGELTGVLDRALAQVQRSRRVSVAVARFTIMPYLLRATPAVANLPATTARLMADEFGLATSPVPVTDPPTFNVSLVWHARNDADPALIWFRGVVTAVLASL